MTPEARLFGEGRARPVSLIGGFVIGYLVSGYPLCARCGWTGTRRAQGTGQSPLSQHRKGAPCQLSRLGQWEKTLTKKDRSALIRAYGGEWEARFRPMHPDMMRAELDRAREALNR